MSTAMVSISMVKSAVPGWFGAALVLSCSDSGRPEWFCAAEIQQGKSEINRMVNRCGDTVKLWFGLENSISGSIYIRFIPFTNL